MAGVAVDIHRDKTLPPGPVRPKPLLADRITRMRVPVQVDTVRVRRGSVTYHERLRPREEYGSIAFTHIAGVLTGYWHLSQISVAIGQPVAAGDVLGLVGNTGRSTGAHLHWEMRIYGIAVDPMQFLEIPLLAPQ